MKKTITVSYHWWPRGNVNNAVPKKHREALIESAETEIFSRLNGDYTSGGLEDTVQAEEGGEWADYSGWWTVVRE